jgi:hypothetical protein
MQTSKSNKSSRASGASKDNEGDVKELMWLLDIGFNVRDVTKLALQQQRQNQGAH